MADYEDIIKNPNFGRHYKSNSNVKKLADTILAELYPNVKVHVDSGNKVQFSYGPMGNKLMSFEEARTASLLNPTLRSTRTYTGGADTHYTGAATNAIADWVASKGYRVDVQRHAFEDADDLTQFMSKYKTGTGKDTRLMGLPIPRGDKGINLFNVYQGDRQLSFGEISDIFGFQLDETSDNIIKRLSILTSDRELAFLASQKDRYKVHLFDPQQVTKATDPNVDQAVRSLLKTEGGAGKIKTVEDIYEAMSDGENFISEKAANRLIAQVKSKGDQILAETQANIPAKGTDAYRVYLQQKQLGERFREIAEEQARNLRDGGRFNFRLMNGIDQNGDAVQLLKGDVGVKTTAAIKRILPHLSEDEIDATDVFASKADVKREFSASELTYQTFESHGMPRQARSNLLTSATHQELMDVDNHLIRGTNREIEAHIKDLSEGRISKGFREILQEMSNVEIDDFDSLADQKAAMESKAFARRMSMMLESGININENEFLTGQLFSAMKKHYTTVKKQGDLKDPRVLMFNGKANPHYNLTFPIRGSIGGHISRYAEDDTLLQGTIKIKPGVLQMHGIDIFKSYGAFGGFDLDDRLAPILQYDSTAKRLLALTIREPNEAAEYMFFDADISQHKAIPANIRRAYAKHRELGIQIAQSQKTLKQKSDMLRERDQLGDLLDNYFRNNRDIAQINLAETFANRTDRPNFLPMPKGFVRDDAAMADYVSGSGLRSFKRSGEFTSGKNASRELVSKMKRELAREATDQAGSMPFRYAGRGVSEWHSKYFTSLIEPDTDKVLKPIEQRIAERAEMEVASKGALGRASNLSATIDEFMRSNLKGLPPELANELDKILKGKSFLHIDKELVVDTWKKTGAAGVIEMVENAMVSNANQLGVTIAKLQQRAAELGIKESIGIDPVMLADRINTNPNTPSAFVENILAGYNSISAIQVTDINKLALSTTDSKAYIAKLMGGLIDEAQGLEESGGALTDAARIRRLESISSIAFTPQEIDRASDFISHMSSAEKDLRKLLEVDDAPFGKLQALLEAAEAGEDINDSLSTAALRKLNEFGLFKKQMADGKVVLGSTPELDRQLIAISKLLGENKGSLSNLMSLGGETTSIGDLFLGAQQRLVYGKSTLDEIGSISKFDDIKKFIRQGKNGLQFTEEARGIYDPAERGMALLDKIMSLNTTNTYGAGRLRKMGENASFILEDLKGSGQFDNRALERYSNQILSRLDSRNRTVLSEMGPISTPSYRPRQSMVGDLPAGLGRFTVREAADEAADEVLAMGRESMTRLDSAFMRKIWNEPIGRKSIIGLGLFAGVGIVHRLTRNPTPEEVGGPPLLPGGSAYEDYDNINFSAVSSMYGSTSNNGMMYSVNTSSNYDPNELGKNLSAITGGSSSTNIYRSRQTTGNRNSSSRDILAAMQGQ